MGRVLFKYEDILRGGGGGGGKHTNTKWGPPASTSQKSFFKRSCLWPEKEEDRVGKKGIQSNIGRRDVSHGSRSRGIAASRVTTQKRTHQDRIPPQSRGSLRLMCLHPTSGHDCEKKKKDLRKKALEEESFGNLRERGRD